MKDSLGEFGDGGVVLQDLFLERVSKYPPVLEGLRAGLHYRGHELRKFLSAWSRQCHVDTQWFRESGRLTLCCWAAGEQVTELMPPVGRAIPITLRVFPQVQSDRAILAEVARLASKAGLTKARIVHKKSVIRRIDWLIRHDVKEEPTTSILKTANISETKFYSALRDLRRKLGIPQQPS